MSKLFGLVESLLHAVLERKIDVRNICGTFTEITTYLDTSAHSLQNFLPVFGMGQSALLYVTNLFLIIFKFFL